MGAEKSENNEMTGRHNIAGNIAKAKWHRHSGPGKHQTHAFQMAT